MRNKHTLPWLLKPTEDIDNKINSIESRHDATELLKYSLNINQLKKISSRLDQSKSNKGSIKLAILSNSNLDYITPAINATCLRYDLDVSIFTSTYNSVASELLNHDSEYFKFSPDVTLLYLDDNFYKIKNHFDTDLDFDKVLKDSLSLLERFIDAAESINSTVCLTNLVRTKENIFGNECMSFKGSSSFITNEINNKLQNLFLDTKNLIIDINSLAYEIGSNNWFSKKQWFVTKTPIDINIIPLFSDYFCSALSALYGKTKKCIVVDLDNTLWGGIVGEDGINNLELGAYSPLGEAFTDFQKTLLDYRSKGMLLAVASKNDFDIAIDVFKNHKDMLIKEDDVAMFEINWNNKADSIIQIAKNLNIGLDSIIFVDDNPAERYIVSSNLSEVTVINLSEDPSEYSEMLTSCGHLEQLAITSEDLKRADNYKIDKKRKVLEKKAIDYAQYLKSLKMSLEFKSFSAEDISRISQLCNKSNQFNLTTKRYTEKDIEKIMTNKDFITLTLKLKDKFDDMGIIGLVICTLDQDKLEIDTWLMSCRVLKRDIEKATLNEIIKISNKNKIKTIIGKYYPTAKNNLVKEHYSSLGFTNIIQNIDYSSWNIQVESYKPYKTMIDIDEYN